jgi:hypothetical protein
VPFVPIMETNAIDQHELRGRTGIFRLQDGGRNVALSVYNRGYGADDPQYAQTDGSPGLSNHLLIRFF